MLNKKLSSLAAITCLSIAGLAFANSHLPVVITKEHMPVMTMGGDCVRHMGMLGSDPCPMNIVAYPEATVHFAFNKADLTDEAKSMLDNLMDGKLKQSHVVGVKIVGYTDRIGSNEYNKILSQKRARVVQAYLADSGYTRASIVYVRGAGESYTAKCDQNQSRDDVVQCLQPDRKTEIMLEVRRPGIWMKNEGADMYQRDRFYHDTYMDQHVRMWHNHEMMEGKKMHKDVHHKKTAKHHKKSAPKSAVKVEMPAEKHDAKPMMEEKKEMHNEVKKDMHNEAKPMVKEMPKEEAPMKKEEKDMGK